MGPAQGRAAARFFRAGSRVGELRAYRVAGVPRSTCPYRSAARDQAALRLRVRDLAAARVRCGCRRLRALLQREGWRVNRKRASWLYREEGLGIRVKRRRKRASGPRALPRPLLGRTSGGASTSWPTASSTGAASGSRRQSIT